VSAADKILTESRLKAIVAGHRRAGRRIVLTNGAFDLLHVGHVRALEEAATLGGVLVVAVNSDAGVRAAKGAGRPVVPERERAEMVAALACVDHVMLFHDATVDRLLEALRPDVHAKGRDYTVDTVPERATAQRLGIETAIVGDAKEHSSSVLVARAGAAMLPLDRVVEVDAGDGRGLALREARRLLAEDGWLDFRRLVLGTEGVRVGGSGGAFVRRLEVRGQPLFVKGSLPLDRARAPLAAFEDLLALRAAGFRTPEPWLALEGRLDGHRAGVLVTREARGLPLHEHLALALPQASPRERATMARGLGASLKALHTARFMLPDLAAPHLLVDGTLAGGARSLVFVNPRGLARGGRRLKRRAAAAGLATLAASLREFTPRRFRLAVLRAYLAGSLRAARPWLDAIRRRLPR
jgi:rfaE bifunctional protein nucleotidyltransferase chain/domain